MEELELRMYFFVPYQLTGIQQGIQSGHAALEFALKYGRYYPTHIIWTFIEKYKTWVILNGGTTNSTYDVDGTPKGSLNQIAQSLRENNIEHEVFYEPDLNEALSAVCFICDERVFNKEKYPDFFDYLISMGMRKDQLVKSIANKIDLKESCSIFYEEWTNLLGGKKNVFLRELINGKKLA